MDRLDDYCLLHIFRFLGPVNWIKASKVCTRWERVSKRMWEKNLTLKSQNRIEYSDCSESEQENEIDSMIVVDNETAVNMLQNAASQIRHLALDVSDFYKSYCGTVIKFGSSKPFLVNDLRLHDAIDILKKFSRNIIRMHILVPRLNADLFELLHTELLIRLNTELKQLKLSYNGNILNHVNSQLESLTLQKVDLTQINFCTMEKICSELKTLNIQIDYAPYLEIINSMEQLSECAPKLKKMFLDMKFKTELQTRPLHFLKNLHFLEHIHIVNSGYQNFQLCYRFICDWVSECPSLKIVKLYRISVSMKSFETLLLIPKLEVLEISEIPDMPSIGQQNLPNLKELSIGFTESKINWQNLIDAIAKMPALSRLDVTFLPEEIIMELTEKVISVFTQLSKIVIVAVYSFGDQLKIYDQSLGLINERTEKLYAKIVLITNPCYVVGDQNSYFNKVKKFVRKSMVNCIVEDVSWS